MSSEVVRLLKADEIECRVGSINEKGVSLLLYKDARVDQRILDETFGPFSWKRSHEMIDGDLYCTVSVFDAEYDMWVSKQDVGVSANAEKEKSRASDAFKRACVNWGIGRELYSAPFIWLDAAKAKVQRKERNGKDYFYTNERFSVASISYDEEKRSITSLRVVNQRGEAVFCYGAQAENQQENEPKAMIRGITARQKTSLDKQLERTGVNIRAVLDRYHISGMEDMTPDIYKNAMNDLKKTADKAA